MHNTHYIIASGYDADDVTSTVESTLDNFGNENNWYSVDYVIDLNECSLQELETVREHLKDLNDYTSRDRLERLMQELPELIGKASKEHREYYWQISDTAIEIYNLIGVSGEYTVKGILDGECNDFNGYTYDKYGITDISDRDNEDEHIFFCIVDMHS